MADRVATADRGAGEALYRLDAGPYRAGELRVAGFRGHEWISRPYRWEVSVEAPNEPLHVLETSLLAQPACLDLTLNGLAPRVVHGVVGAVRRLRATPDGATLHARVRVVPRLWLLSRNRLSRVFQDMSVLEIVREILDEAGIAWEARLQRPHPRRVYCVQYQESSLAFVMRLLAEEGIFYFFEQPAFPLADEGVARIAGALINGLLSERVVFADGVGGIRGIPRRLEDYSPVAATRPPTLLYHHGDGAIAEEHHVARFSRARVVQPQAVVLRDYDFRRPQSELGAAQTAVPVAATDDDGPGFQDAVRDALEGVGRISRTSLPPIALDPTLATVFEHHGEHEDPDVNRVTAQHRLEQVRGRAEVAEGESWCRRLSPGHRFTLDLHRDVSLDGEYTVTEVIHAGRTGEPTRRGVIPVAYRNSFRCVPAYTAPRPARPRRVHQQVIETARVMGPPGEDIHTDAYGRIKVRFHWDLAGPEDGRSSCWIRPAQAWAGGGWGTQFIPRVGMEVLVGFIGGDKDRPVVLGCVYNGENTPAFAVPGDKTRSGIRTESSPGGGGYNELSFEDRAGSERVYLRAQRELDEEVGARRELRVGVASQDNPTGEGMLDERVATDRTTDIGRDDSRRVGRDQCTVVHRDATSRISGRHHREVHGASTSVVGGATYRLSRGESREEFGRDLTVTVRDNRVERVGRDSRRTIGGDDLTVAAGSSRAVVGGDRSLSVAGSWSASVGRSLSFAALRSTRIAAEESIVLQCGESVVELTPDAVSIRGPEIRVAATERLVITAAKASFVMEDDAIAVDAKSSIELTSDDAIRLAASDVAASLDAGGGELEMKAPKIALGAQSACLELSSDATLIGSSVHLNPKSTATKSASKDASPEELRTSWVELRLVDDQDFPISGARFIVEMSDGRLLEGCLNWEGFAHVSIVPGAAKVTFPEFDASCWK